MLLTTTKKPNTQKNPNHPPTPPYYAVSEHDDNQQHNSQQLPEWFSLHSRKSPTTETTYIQKFIEWSIFCCLQIFTLYSLGTIQKSIILFQGQMKKDKLRLDSLLPPSRTLHQIYCI